MSRFVPGFDLVNALTAAGSGGAPLIYTGGDTATSLLRQPPVTAHDALYIRKVISSRAGGQPALMRSVQRTAAGVSGDCDLSDSSYSGAAWQSIFDTSSVYGPTSAGGTLAMFDQVRLNSADQFFTPASSGIEVYGLLIEIQAAQNVSLPAIDFDIKGTSFAANVYGGNSAAVTDATIQADGTGGYNSAKGANIAFSGSISPPADISYAQRQRVRFLVLPAVTYNGQFYYTPFVCRPTTSAATTPNQAPTVGAPGRSVVFVRLNGGRALPTGTTVNYQFLTRGTPDVENLIARDVSRDRFLSKVATQAGA